MPQTLTKTPTPIEPVTVLCFLRIRNAINITRISRVTVTEIAIVTS
jgi:hypothetical protein